MDVNFWPSLSCKIQTKLTEGDQGTSTERDQETEEIICQLCQDNNLLIAGVTPGQADKTKKYEDGVMLRCGHVFGLNCMEKWKTALCEKESRPFTCPSCRAVLFRDGCSEHKSESKAGALLWVPEKETDGTDSFQRLSSFIQEFQGTTARDEAKAKSCLECAAIASGRAIPIPTREAAPRPPQLLLSREELARIMSEVPDNKPETLETQYWARPAPSS